ncbi:MAG: hypothetical protein RL612_224 [Actinomycetota bacterium]
MPSSKGIIQGVGLLGLSIAGALLLQSHGPVSSANANTTASGSATGDAIDYQYGTVQLKVTKSDGKITAIDLVQAGANGGREQAFSYLVSDAINANGSSFGNLSGATFTTDAFKQALDSALSKLA